MNLDLKITESLSNDKPALTEFINRNIIPVLLEDTRNFYKNFKNYFDERDKFYFENKIGGLQSIVTLALRKYGFSAGNNSPNWWSPVRGLTRAIYHGFLKDMVGSLDSLNWDTDKYAEYFIKDFSHAKQGFYRFYKQNRLKLIYSKKFAVYGKYAKLIAKLLTDDESVLSGVEESPKHNLSNYLLNVSNKIFELTGIQPAPIRGNFEYIYRKRIGKKDNSFSSPNDIRILTEYVLDNPTDFLIDAKTNYYLFVRMNGKDKLVVLELSFRKDQKYYQVKSAYYTSKSQWATKIKNTGGRYANPDIVGMTNKSHIATGDCTSTK